MATTIDLLTKDDMTVTKGDTSVTKGDIPVVRGDIPVTRESLYPPYPLLQNVDHPFTRG